jgi:hypothetical protein
MSESTSSSKYQIPQIEWDTERDEPFCNIVIKGEEYRMTMWRESDGDDMVSLLCSGLGMTTADNPTGPKLGSSISRKMEFQAALPVCPSIFHSIPPN